MRFGSPIAKADHFERDGAIETLLVGTIHYALTASSDFLEQLVVTKIYEPSCRSRLFRSRRYLHAFIAAGLNDPGYGFLFEQTEAGF